MNTAPPSRRRLPAWLPPATRVAVGVACLAAGGYYAAKAALDAGRPELAAALEKAALVAASTFCTAAPAPVGGTLMMSAQRVIGGAVGGSLAAALSLLGAGGWQAAAQAGVGAVFAAAAAYVGQDSAVQYGANFAVVCYIVVVASAGSRRGVAATLAVARGVGALAGAVAASLLSILVLPQPATRAAYNALQDALDGVAGLVGECLGEREGAVVDARTQPPGPAAPAAAAAVGRIVASLNTLDTCLEWAPTEKRAFGNCYVPAAPWAGDAGAARDAALGGAARAARAAALTLWLAAAAGARPCTPAGDAAALSFNGGKALGELAAPAAQAWAALAASWAARAAPPPDATSSLRAAADALTSAAASAMASRRAEFKGTGRWPWAAGLAETDARTARVHALAAATLAARLAADVETTVAALAVAAAVVAAGG